MRGMTALIALVVAACGQEQPGATAEGSDVPVPTAPQSSVAGAPAATKASLLAVPSDRHELQRMIDLGYSVHEDHLHPPGAKECPFAGGDMVQ